MSVQKALMTVIPTPNAKIQLAITSVLANKDFMEMEGQAAQVKKNLEKSKIHVQSIDLVFLWAFLIFFSHFLPRDRKTRGFPSSRRSTGG